jgi:hypothetical protein
MASIEIASGWVDAVQKYIDGLVANSVAAAESATQFFHQAVVERARQDEDWSSLADNITVWSQDGLMYIGVNDPMFVSQATLLEYGDQDASPNPLFRTLESAARDANADMQANLHSHYGPAMDVGAPRIKGMKYGG